MAYHGRRGPNVSEYIANLNAIPSAQEMQSLNQENFNFENDLALFTNTQFFDFDQGQDADLQATNYGLEGIGGQSSAAPDNGELKALDFSAGDFSFTDFDNFPPADFTSNIPLPPPIQTNQPPYHSPSNAGSPLSATAPPLSASSHKRKAASISASQSSPSADTFEDASRLAAEEDKRRRNTAASARFRVKKKQREQALEKSAKEMSDKVSALEGRINQLETENKWLKNLITEKNESKEDIAALWKKYNQENGERKESERKAGVGPEGKGKGVEA